jgi:hypothetical protein
MRKVETFMERRKEELMKKRTLEGKVLERERERERGRVNSQRKELWREEEKAENAGENPIQTVWVFERINLIYLIINFIILLLSF